MTIRQRGRRSSCCRAVLLLLSIVLLERVSEMRALATCGDWLAHPAPSHSAADRTSSNSDDSSLASNEQPSPLPCNGPYCRSAPPKPVPTTPPSTVNPSDRLLLAAQEILCDPLSRWSFMRREAAAHALRGFPVDIEHPPRA